MFGELEDILDEIVPDSSDCIIHDEEFMDTVLQLMEEYISENIEELMEEDFHESFINEIFDRATIIKPSVVYSVDDSFTTRFLGLINILPFFPLYYKGLT